MSKDTFKTQSSLNVNQQDYTYYNLKTLEKKGHNINRLPYCLKVLLENLLRHEDDLAVNAQDIEALLKWDPKAEPSTEINFTPSRVILQDFTGVPAVADLAALKNAMKEMGGDPDKINPLLPSELVIDHSVQVDHFGSNDALTQNTQKEFERNKERYEFLKWGQETLKNFKVVPPETGIVHQVNTEYLARVVFGADKDGVLTAYPDTLVGTDSHTTMVNGLGVLGWGVGGIEAEAAMLGQPIPLLIPQVIGFKLTGALPEGATATDLVLTITKMLRDKGVVGKFVEFFGEGLDQLTLADRATISNMSPEFGSTSAVFPIDDQTLEYLRFTARSQEQINLVEAYAKAQGLFRDENIVAEYTDVLELDISTVVPTISGPKRPQDKILLKDAKTNFIKVLPEIEAGTPSAQDVPTTLNGKSFNMNSGDVVIAAITSCTNTSNPSVLIGAGLVAKKAVELGLQTKPWVKTSLAPGSQVVTEYLKEAGLLEYLEKIRFNVVGYGCTTCIGNSGPLPTEVSESIQKGNLVATSVLSGNRNFEGRINPSVRANYLASPPLVVAYALKGTMIWDTENEPLGQDKDGNDVFLKDIWPTQAEISKAVKKSVKSEMFAAKYGEVFKGTASWQAVDAPKGDLFPWDADSTYIQRPAFFTNMKATPEPVTNISGARVLAVLGDSVTTDHISPAGSIAKDSPAAQYLTSKGVDAKDFNSYGSRRGNHEVMMRGTFANIRLRNLLAPGTEGGITRYLPTNEQMSIYDASLKYQSDNIPLVILAGKEYGSGSSRDWAAKGTNMLGVKAVIAESYERIHRSNLIGMGVLPLEFLDGENVKSLGLTGEEEISISGIANDLSPGKVLEVKAGDKTFKAKTRIDTPVELEYFKNGGILQYVLRGLIKNA